MNSKLRSTTVGLFAALTFAAATALVGEPVPASAEMGTTSLQGAMATPESTSVDAPATRKRQTVRVNLAMPYYSFGRLLPRRES